ncbi:hypothetical protein EJ04DRAFT_571529 [Polyplosphaeria fusca]|uniref:Uncharacterized protein n=1 Tax=Polyplosphaeria fusca TaxID=682080 RepID=A0A9P4RDK1_9PLEO|nr:hypothetical protein EJ04DRAFT_571529 [Polyplosphaeria fusca]
MAESQDKQATFEDMQMEDFVRICEFAYYQDYTTPECVRTEELSDDSRDEAVPEPTPEPTPAPVEAAAERPPPSVEDGEWGWAFSFPSNRKKWKAILKANMRRELFEEKRFLPDGFLHRNTTNERFAIHTNTSRKEGRLHPVFLAHARLYTIADKYLIESLRGLVVHKLQQTLKGFTLHKSRVNDVIELIRYRYVYSEDHMLFGWSTLRFMVVEYVVCEIDVFGKHSCFLDLLDEGGEFVVDFWVEVRKSLL